MTPPPTLDELIRLVRQDAASEDRLDQLATAALTVQSLAETGDAVLGHYVDQARAGGHTWTEISNVLGVSKQAVHKRFTGDAAFSSYTDRARSAVAAAEGAARRLGHKYIGTEHLLLGLVADSVRDGVAAKILAERGITQETLDNAVVERIGRGQGSGDAQVPFTPRARKILAQSVSDVAGGLGHVYAGTEHILIAVSENTGVAKDVLADLGVTAEIARADVVKALSDFESGK
ncbi:MAG TPA: Clp protease N-terminal domain-containing protein [Mycobacteriales bacterium]|nr:Clp protease N-terminal domain-containing protein [Mycobacteriales bacterium]